MPSADFNHNLKKIITLNYSGGAVNVKIKKIALILGSLKARQFKRLHLAGKSLCNNKN